MNASHMAFLKLQRNLRAIDMFKHIEIDVDIYTIIIEGNIDSLISFLIQVKFCCYKH